MNYYDPFKNMNKAEKIILTFIIISVFVVVLAFIVGQIGDFVSANGYNIIDGIHIHKTLFGYLAILGGVYIWYDRKEWDWLSLGLILIGTIIVLYDVLVWSMPWPITLV
jgi:hypothetical protein